jgi:NAD(P)-dependent dehydrogenase (short-subunit alcohol dehydrogenase family)
MYRASPTDGLAWVTGASSGIGRAVAIELARRGYLVAATARRATELEALAATSPRIFSFPGDVTDRAGIAALARKAEAAHGPIALAFVNAAIYLPAERDRFDADLIGRTFETNVGGTVNCLEPVLAAMEKRGRGQVAITSSLAGYGGIPGSLAYGSTKAALIYMAEALRLTYAPAGLTIQIRDDGAGHGFRHAFHHRRGGGGQADLRRFREGRLRNRLPPPARLCFQGRLSFALCAVFPADGARDAAGAAGSLMFYICNCAAYSAVTPQQDHAAQPRQKPDPKGNGDVGGFLGAIFLPPALRANALRQKGSDAGQIYANQVHQKQGQRADGPLRMADEQQPERHQRRQQGHRHHHANHRGRHARRERQSAGGA